jgi:hypothetical protein
MKDGFGFRFLLPPANLRLSYRSFSAVIVHELWLHLNWMAKAAENRAKNRLGEHGPEHYAAPLGGVLRRAETGFGGERRSSE